MGGVAKAKYGDRNVMIACLGRQATWCAHDKHAAVCCYILLKPVASASGKVRPLHLPVRADVAVLDCSPSFKRSLRSRFRERPAAEHTRLSNHFWKKSSIETKPWMFPSVARQTERDNLFQLLRKKQQERLPSVSVFEWVDIVQGFSN